MHRREFLGASVAIAAAGSFDCMSTLASPSIDTIPIIDTHIHLFDTTRPQGAPYKGSKQFQQESSVALPSTYRRLAEPLGIVGAIEIEASPWIEDNLWVLEIAQTDPIMVGTIGNLRPEKPEFPEYLERYHRNPLFRGIRYGNLWNYDLVEQVANPVFLDGLKLLAEADLVLDTANPRVDLLQAVLKINDKVPDLRIVIDHLPSLEVKPDEKSDYDAVLREIPSRQNVFVKLSEIEHRVSGQPNGQVELGLDAHRSRLDLLTGVFGEDRVLFGSDWPNSVGTATLQQIVALVRAYYSEESRAAAEKYFWRNSLQVYKWIKRSTNQLQLK
jgi:L-fuconolactonase